MGYLLIITIIFIIDLVIKTIVEQRCKQGEEKSYCEGKFIIQKYHNKGFALNAFEKYPKFVANGPALLCGGMFATLLVLLLKKGYGAVKLALSLIIGGAASNIYDRYSKHYVVDYIRFGVKWKWLREIVFNFSDFCIIAGTILLVLSQINKKE